MSLRRRDDVRSTGAADTGDVPRSDREQVTPSGLQAAEHHVPGRAADGLDLRAGADDEPRRWRAAVPARPPGDCRRSVAGLCPGIRRPRDDRMLRIDDPAAEQPVDGAEVDVDPVHAQLVLTVARADQGQVAVQRADVPCRSYVRSGDVREGIGDRRAVQRHLDVDRLIRVGIGCPARDSDRRQGAGPFRRLEGAERGEVELDRPAGERLFRDRSGRDVGARHAHAMRTRHRQGHGRRVPVVGAGSGQSARDDRLEVVRRDRSHLVAVDPDVNLDRARRVRVDRPARDAESARRLAQRVDRAARLVVDRDGAAGQPEVRAGT